MRRTNRLGLPIFDNPNTDKFGLDEWNYANETIDDVYDEIDNFRKEIPKVNASAEVIEARKGNATLGKRIDNIDNDLKNASSKLEEKAQRVALEVEKARIDNIVASGTITEGNSELIDIRVGLDGKTYETAGSSIRENLLVLKEDLRVDTPQDLLENTTFEIGYQSGATFLPTLTGFRVSAFVPIKHNCYYKITGIDSSTNVVATLFDENGTYITGITPSQITNGVFLVGNNASIKKAKFNFTSLKVVEATVKECMSDGTLIVTQGHKIREFVKASSVEIKNYVSENLSNMLSKYNGKKANFKGDSIVKGTYTPFGGQSADTVVSKRFTDVVGEKLGLEVVRNYGENGATISSLGVAYSILATYPTMDNDADLIVIAGGTNDYGKNVPLGTSSDKTDISFYGALYMLCNGLINKYLGKKIIFISPIHRSSEGANSIGHTLQQYKQAISEVCKKFGIPVIDGFDLGLTCENTLMKDTYINDGVHPNEAGQILYGDNLAPIIETL